MVDPKLKEEIEKLKKEIRSIILSSASQEGITAARLDLDYADVHGVPIPFAKLGFKSLEDLLSEITDVVYKLGEAYQPVPNSSTRHLEKFINNQKPSRLTRLGGTIPIEVLQDKLRERFEVILDKHGGKMLLQNLVTIYKRDHGESINTQRLFKSTLEETLSKGHLSNYFSISKSDGGKTIITSGGKWNSFSQQPRTDRFVIPRLPFAFNMPPPRNLFNLPSLAFANPPPPFPNHPNYLRFPPPSDPRFWTVGWWHGGPPPPQPMDSASTLPSLLDLKLTTPPRLETGSGDNRATPSETSGLHRKQPCTSKSASCSDLTQIKSKSSAGREVSSESKSKSLGSPSKSKSSGEPSTPTEPLSFSLDQLKIGVLLLLRERYPQGVLISKLQQLFASSYGLAFNPMSTFGIPWSDFLARNLKDYCDIETMMVGSENPTVHMVTLTQTGYQETEELSGYFPIPNSSTSEDSPQREVVNLETLSLGANGGLSQMHNSQTPSDGEKGLEIELDDLANELNDKDKSSEVMSPTPLSKMNVCMDIIRNFGSQGIEISQLEQEYQRITNRSLNLENSGILAALQMFCQSASTRDGGLVLKMASQEKGSFPLPTEECPRTPTPDEVSQALSTQIQVLLRNNPKGLLIQDLQTILKADYNVEVNTQTVMDIVIENAHVLSLNHESFGKLRISLIPTESKGKGRGGTSSPSNSSANASPPRRRMPTDAVTLLYCFETEDMFDIPSSVIGGNYKTLRRVVLSQFYSVSEFYISLYKQHPITLRLMTEMDEFYAENNSYRVQSSQLEPGFPVAVPYETFGYHRAEILNVSEDNAEIQVNFVDFGTREVVPAASAQLLTRKFVDTLKAQAVRCRLAQVRVPEDISEEMQQKLRKMFQYSTGAGDEEPFRVSLEYCVGPSEYAVDIEYESESGASQSLSQNVLQFLQEHEMEQTFTHETTDSKYSQATAVARFDEERLGAADVFSPTSLAEVPSSLSPASSVSSAVKHPVGREFVQGICAKILNGTISVESGQAIHSLLTEKQNKILETIRNEGEVSVTEGEQLSEVMSEIHQLETALEEMKTRAAVASILSSQSEPEPQEPTDHTTERVKEKLQDTNTTLNPQAPDFIPGMAAECGSSSGSGSPLARSGSVGAMFGGGSWGRHFSLLQHPIRPVGVQIQHQQPVPMVPPNNMNMNPMNMNVAHNPMQQMNPNMVYVQQNQPLPNGHVLTGVGGRAVVGRHDAYTLPLSQENLQQSFEY